MADQPKHESEEDRKKREADKKRADEAARKPEPDHHK
jgi:hypothetical protein